MRVELLALLSAFLMSCVQAPTVGDEYKRVHFDHPSGLTACNSCHESDRPGGDHIQVVDCVGCHRTSSWEDPFSFRHTAGLSSCTTCHEDERPAAPHNASDDCVSCHNTSSWDDVDERPHAETGSTASSVLDCALCHDQSGTATHKLAVPTANHYYEATSCIGCHSNFTNFTDYLKYSHSSKVQSGYCYECHNFTGGSYTSYTSVATFNTTGTRTITSARNVTGSFDDDSFTLPHSNAGFARCSSCHTYTAPGAGVNIWRFRHRPSNPGVSNTTNSLGCNICH